MTPHTEHDKVLIGLIEQYDKNPLSTPFIVGYAKYCFDVIKKKGDKLIVADITSLVDAVYRMCTERMSDRMLKWHNDCCKLCPPDQQK